MDLIIGNPAGWWALAGIPAILLIHLLQHEARRYTVSTLFLVEHLAHESAEGRIIERIRNSAQLWLQLLAVLLLTWLLLQPRWLREDSFQRVVVLLDSSVSMRAILDDIPPGASEGLARLDRAAARTEWRLIETDPGRETLYAGLRLDELVETLRDWTPRLGSHSFLPAFQVARSLAGPGGSIVLVTDRPPEIVPEGIEVLAMGKPIENVGFTGLRVLTDRESGALSWQAMVRNHGRTVQRRSWSIAIENGPTRSQTLELNPGATRVLRGGFPDDRDALVLTLEADAFTMDDRLPMVRPEPKPVRVSLQVDEPTRMFATRFLATLQDRVTVRRSQDPDIEMLSYDPGVVPALAANGICLPRGEGTGAAQEESPGLVVHESHPLTEGLSWQGLLCRPVGPVTLTGDERVLVWLGEHPLIYLRGDDSLRQVVVAFDLATSNADRLPAFIVLLHRFVESVRAQKPVFEARNVEVNQLLDLVAEPNGGDVERTINGVPDLPLPPARAHLLRAPHETGLFRVRQGDVARLFAAARFADTREADFGDASTTPGIRERAELISRRNSRRDAWAPLWTLLAVASIIASWAWKRGP